MDNPGFESWQGQESELFPKLARLVLGPTHFPIQWVMGTTGMKLLGHDADRSPPTSAEVKNEWSYTFIPHIVSTGTILPFFTRNMTDSK